MNEQKKLMEYETIALDDVNSALVIIDQTKLPNETKLLHLTTQQEIWDAIYLLQVRGAPAIGCAAAIGIYLAAKVIESQDYDVFYAGFCRAKEFLNSSRPTAVNLSWALNRMDNIVKRSAKLPVPEIKQVLCREAEQIKLEDAEVCRRIGEYGLTLVTPGAGLLTHCNAGQLATARYGTATAPMYLGHERGYGFRIFADETRPLLQGARLTAYELHEAGLDVTLICDNMAATVMKNGWIQAVFVGCDRVAANGDTANKIGTSMVAIAAKRYNIPFYVCAPTSTIDLATPTGKNIEIEERAGSEVTAMWYKKPMAPEGVKTFNPAFDVTESDLITAIITENGIAYPPFNDSLPSMLAGSDK